MPLDSCIIFCFCALPHVCRAAIVRACPCNDYRVRLFLSPASPKRQTSCHRRVCKKNGASFFVSHCAQRYSSDKDKGQDRVQIVKGCQGAKGWVTKIEIEVCFASFGIGLGAKGWPLPSSNGAQTCFVSSPQASESGTSTAGSRRRSSWRLHCRIHRSSWAH